MFLIGSTERKGGKDENDMDFGAEQERFYSRAGDIL
jgi:hypothetical protein